MQQTCCPSDNDPGCCVEMCPPLVTAHLTLFPVIHPVSPRPTSGPVRVRIESSDVIHSMLQDMGLLIFLSGSGVIQSGSKLGGPDTVGFLVVSVYLGSRLFDHFLTIEIFPCPLQGRLFSFLKLLLLVCHLMLVQETI